MHKHDTMTAYVADRAPHLAPFPYFRKPAGQVAA